MAGREPVIIPWAKEPEKPFNRACLLISPEAVVTATADIRPRLLSTAFGWAKDLLLNVREMWP
jgi:hypothetical protein